jgi:hypothetical protein
MCTNICSVVFLITWKKQKHLPYFRVDQTNDRHYNHKTTTNTNNDQNCNDTLKRKSLLHIKCTSNLIINPTQEIGHVNGNLTQSHTTPIIYISKLFSNTLCKFALLYILSWKHTFHTCSVILLYSGSLCLNWQHISNTNKGAIDSSLYDSNNIVTYRLQEAPYLVLP